MNSRTPFVGALLATFTGVVWGGQFVVGKSALARIDAFWLTSIRYALAALLLLGVLLAVEGRAALRLDGRLVQLTILGTLGFAAFNLLAYTGLAHARPQSASLIVALSPLLMALVLWVRDGQRPTRVTLIALVVALTGVALVISRGHVSTLWKGSLGWGDVLVLGGVLSFVLYTAGAAKHRDLSALRFTALTAALGWPAIMAATLVGTAAGWLSVPSGNDVVAVSPQILYLAIPGAVIAVVTWNAAVEIIGPQTTSLFGNLIPISTFTIEIVRGYRPTALELAGAALTIAALVGDNLFARWRATESPHRCADISLAAR
ncbi:MAG TPA: DMT family transporter [Gaiellaceae bacterium]|nr:DMT family transporter [Gaiellaceae bacterium]